MSATPTLRPVLPPDIRARKGQVPLVVLTAYTTPMARLVDAHCDVALVGDSVGMVLHGFPSTLGVTMEMMILHGRAVVRGLTKARAVVDMPFGSYEEGPQQAYRNAARLMVETGGTGGEAGGRRAYGGDDRLSDPARSAGDGAHRPDAAIGQHVGRLQGGRARG